MIRCLLPILALLLASPVAPVAAAPRSYDVEYLAEFRPDEKGARVTIRLDHDDGRVTRANFRMPEDRYRDVRADGQWRREGERVIWIPPERGGSLSYLVLIDNKRANGAYDARITERWAIVRGDDLFPPAVVTTTKDTDSQARLRFRLPSGWTNVDTPYLLNRAEDAYVVVNPRRRFDRPVGWIIAGDVGTRREWIDGVEISVAAPKGEGMRRMDVMALVNVTFLELLHAFGSLPPKILIVGAGDPMWRGGLSAPRSFWLHADRPLVSEDATSTVLHELVHVITRVRGRAGADWITEGLAEFYSLEIMRRTGVITEKRWKKAVDFARKRSAGIRSLRTAKSSGPRTARAVVLLVALDEEIRRRTDDRKDIDDVTRRLMEIGKVSTDDLRGIVEKLLGGPSEVLATPLLD